MTLRLRIYSSSYGEIDSFEVFSNRNGQRNLPIRLRQHRDARCDSGKFLLFSLPSIIRFSPVFADFQPVSRTVLPPIDVIAALWMALLDAFNHDDIRAKLASGCVNHGAESPARAFQFDPFG